MRFTIVTLFPEFFDSPLACGLMGKALEAGRVRVDTVNPRDFTEDRHRTVDDRPYGGGPGMVMQPEPLDRALRSIDRPGRMLLLTPRGRPLTQELARELAGEQDLTVVCGRYEGIDARIEQAWPVEPVSVGDFVLNGGEAGALCLLEAVGRLVPEFMGHQDSGEEESFSRGLLEYPHYTRPETWQGMGVPDVLLSGDHGAVAAWRRRAALRTTLQRRPDLLAAAELDSEDLATLRRGEAKRESGSRPAGNLYLALLHHPVFNKEGNILTVSLTNLDIHDIARCSRSFDLGGYYVATPLEDQLALARELLGHWTVGPGAEAIPDRARALSTVRLVRGLDEVLADLAERTGAEPTVVATTAKGPGTTTVGGVQRMLRRGPTLLLLGTGSGLAPQVVDRAHAVLRPVRFLAGYNHLSVRSAASIIVDRIVGDFA